MRFLDFTTTMKTGRPRRQRYAAAVILFAFLTTYFNLRVLGVSPRDSLAVESYRKVEAFNGQVEMIIPVNFKRIKSRKLKDDVSYAVFHHTGFKDKRGNALRLYHTALPFPDDRGIAIWDVIDNVTNQFRSKKQLKSGFVVVDRPKMQLNTLSCKPRTIFFEKILYLDNDENIAYANIMCLELNGKTLVGLICTRDEKFLNSYEEDFYESVTFHD